MNATAVVGYLALFATAGFLFVFGSLLMGRFLRAHAPSPEKLATYECGEPTIGSSYIQFDLRFYVVALLFLVFDVEVSFFFPWAAVFGQATQLRDPVANLVAGSPAQLTDYADQRLRTLGVERPQVPERSLGAAENERRIRQIADRLALVSMADVGVFFAVLLVGFSYVWKRGDLDWVRATEEQAATPEDRPHEPPAARTTVS